MLTTIIFTKDRPAQTDLLLRSIDKYAPETTGALIWKATTKASREGYCVPNAGRAFAQTHVRWWEESSFATNVRDAAFGNTREFVQFLVDDDVYVRPLDLGAAEQLLSDPTVQAVSLRQAPYMDRCYTENMRTDPPVFSRDCKWFWPGLPGDWGYPNSVDGTIYRKADIAPVIAEGKFRNPSELEAVLRGAMTRPLLACFPAQIIANIPNSSVQTAGPANRNGGLSDVETTERFLNGERIVLDAFANLRTPAAHWEVAYQWRKPSEMGPPSMGG